MTLNILGICGSLRRESLNRRLLQALAARVPEATFRLAEIGTLPLFNSDIDDAARLAPVEALKEQISSCDVVIFATPEYNYSITGVLKNAIDWASRPAYRSPFAGKPVGMVSASPGPTGGNRAQAHLKLILLGMLAEVYPAPELAVGGASGKLDEQGDVLDDDLDARLKRYAEGLADFAKRAR